MTSTSDWISERGMHLPTVPTPVGGYVAAVVHNGLVRTTGQLPFRDGKLITTSRLGTEVLVQEGTEAARVAAFNAIAAPAEAVGGTDRIERILEVTGFLAAGEGFREHSTVLYGASNLMTKVFGELGHHVRVNIGVASPPLERPVEIGILAAIAVGSSTSQTQVTRT